jgi:proline iminopeptidase
MRIPIFLFALTSCTGCLDPGEPGNLVPKTVAEDPALPAVELNGLRFHAETYGDPANPVIVFLHGGPGVDYRGLLRLTPLADQYYLVFFDQRGTGLSQRVDADQVTIDTYNDDLDAVIDHYAPGRRVTLVGHSWGGMYASEYLGVHPERVNAAVLLEPGPLTGEKFSQLKSKIAGVDLGSEWASDYLWSQRFLSAADHARLDYAPLIAFRKANPDYHESEVDPEPIWRIGTVAQRALLKSGSPNGEPSWDFGTPAGAFTGPVQLVASGENTVLGESLQSEQMKFYQHATLTVIPGVGHDFPWQRPEDTMAAIRTTMEAL